MPAPLNDCTAAAAVWFVTSGTVALVGCAGAAGAAVVVEDDVDVGAVSVVAVADVANAFARATESVTTDPFASFAPGFGAWSTTVPPGWSLVTCAPAESSPSLSRAACASANDLPVSDGRAAVGAPESITSVTCVPFGTLFASCGFCDTTTLLGCFVGR